MAEAGGEEDLRPLGSRGRAEAGINLGGRKGFFSAVAAAYNNHWLLRTRPGDWWTVVRD